MNYLLLFFISLSLIGCASEYTGSSIAYKNQDHIDAINLEVADIVNIKPLDIPNLVFNDEFLKKYGKHVNGAYKRSENGATIYIRKDSPLRTVFHELVHHYQYYSDSDFLKSNIEKYKKNGCLKPVEVDAYTLANEWCRSRMPCKLIPLDKIKEKAKCNVK